MKIRPEVLEFAKEMSKRLDENEHRTKVRHWSKFQEVELVSRVEQNLLLINRNPIDAANDCFMIWDNRKEDRDADTCE